MAPLPSARRLRDQLLPVRPARASSVIAIVASDSCIETSITAPGVAAMAACMPAQAAAIPPMNADCSPTGRIGASSRSSTWPGQHAGNAAGEAQSQVGRGVIGLRSGLTERRDQDERGRRVVCAETVGVVSSIAQFSGAAFDDDQVGGRERAARRRDDRLAVIEIGGERRRAVRIDACDIRADIGEQAPANGGGEARAELDHVKA